MKRSFMRYAVLVFPSVFFIATLNADTLVLRDGRRIPGQLISMRNDVVEFEAVQTFGGAQTVQFDRDAIQSIEFDRNTARYSAPASQQAQPSQTIQRGRSGLRERQVTVLANVRWVNTNIDVQSGQDVYFEASGEVRWGPNRRDGPGGEQNSPVNPARPMPNRPAAALIGHVGENSQDYFFIGADRGAIRMRSSGRLLLSVNDEYLQDNSGSFRVVVYY